MRLVHFQILQLPTVLVFPLISIGLSLLVYPSFYGSRVVALESVVEPEDAFSALSAQNLPVLEAAPVETPAVLPPELPPVPGVAPGETPAVQPPALPPMLAKPQPLSRTAGQTRLTRAALLGFRYRVVVEAVDEAQKSRIRSLVPDAFRSAYQGKTVMQVGAYREQAEVDEMVQRLSSNGLTPVVEQLPVSPKPTPEPTAQVQPRNSTQNQASSQGDVNAALVAVPSASIPIGNAGNLPPVIVSRSPVLVDPQAGTPPPPPPLRVALLGFRYRVVVEAVDEAQKSRIRSLVPDAFRSAYQGKTVMQVGAYREQAEVDEMVQRLSSNGFTPVVEQLQ